MPFALTGLLKRDSTWSSQRKDREGGRRADGDTPASRSGSHGPGDDVGDSWTSGRDESSAPHPASVPGPAGEEAEPIETDDDGEAFVAEDTDGQWELSGEVHGDQQHDHRDPNERDSVTTLWAWRESSMIASRVARASRTMTTSAFRG